MKDQFETKEALIQELVSLRQRISELERSESERKQVEEDLHESEEKYRNILENIEDGYFEVDRAGDFTFFNPSICRILGYPKEEMLGMNFRAYMDAENAKKVFQAFNEVYVTGIPKKGFEWEVIRKDGARMYIEVSISLIVRPGEKPTRFRGIARDITERKLAEEALHESEGKYRWVLDNMADVITVMDMDLRFTYVSPSIMRMRGYTAEEATAHTFEQVMTPESLQIIAKVFEEEMKLEAGGTADPGRSRILETEQYRKDGSIVCMENHLSFLRDEAQKAVGIISLTHDITDRKRAEEALRESENKYNELAHFLPQIVFETDMKGNITFVNHAAYYISGYSPEDFEKGFNVLQLLVPEEWDRARFNIQGLLHGKELQSNEFTFLRKDGRTFPVIANAVPIVRNNQTVGLRGFVVDITERKRAEEALKKSEERFRELSDSLPQVVFEMDLRGILTYVNRNAFDLFGYTQEDFINGMNALELVIQENREEAGKNIGKIMQGEILGGIEYTVQKKNGEAFPVEIHSRRILHDGKPIGLRGIIIDITERKKDEEHLKETLESLRKAFGVTIQAMVSAIESRDPYTAGHQTRSADLARAIATEMGLSREKIDGIRVAGSIHDIGKLSIPAEILSKPTKLTQIEFSLIKEHARKGYEMLKDVESPWPLAEIVHQHHERMDGSGYPRNLTGDDILIEARILAVADVVEAMASHRPYRPGLGIDAALNEIEKNKGIFYDNAVADACLRLFREKGYKID